MSYKLFRLECIFLQNEEKETTKNGRLSMFFFFGKARTRSRTITRQEEYRNKRKVKVGS